MNQQSEAALLRRFEPILRFTRGERFYPMDIEPYVRRCSLWSKRPEEEAVRLLRPGSVTVQALAQPDLAQPGTMLFLKMTDPLSPTEMAAQYLGRDHAVSYEEETFHAGRGRLARVGYVSRFADALFRLGLLARGRVPGDAAAAAKRDYRQMMAERAHYSYYGRVVRETGWTVLQYWFFYAFDDWRSQFFGANDHEADWEMICVYLSGSEREGYVPEWAAYAAHNEAGDDLRRRWDDPDLDKLGDHPVVYVGAGSHASYFRRGEYLTEVELPVLAPLVRLTDRAREFWYRTLRQYGGEKRQNGQGDGSNIFRIPFVDYARGDGRGVGPGQDEEWQEPRLLEPPPPWLTGYRGLWGLYTHDPFEGEDAPAGPMYNRDGTVRSSWYDPLGWAGLDKVPPEGITLDLIRQRQEEIERQTTAADAAIEEQSRALQVLGTEAEAIRAQAAAAAGVSESQRGQVDALAGETEALRAQAASDRVLQDLLANYAERLKEGYRDPPRAHLRRPHEPASDADLRFESAAEAWAAISIGLMLVGFIAVLIFARDQLVGWLIAIFILLVVIEATFRRRLEALVTAVTIGLALVAAGVLIYEFWWQILIAIALAAALYVLWDNLREFIRA